MDRESCDNAVFNLLLYGKENAKTRAELSERTGAHDREVREGIERLRKKYIILNDQDGNGYYLSENVREIVRYYMQEFKRAVSILARLKPMRGFLRDRGIKASRIERWIKDKKAA